jgi:hypothetical protein
LALTGGRPNHCNSGWACEPIYDIDVRGGGDRATARQARPWHASFDPILGKQRGLHEHADVFG